VSMSGEKTPRSSSRPRKLGPPWGRIVVPAQKVQSTPTASVPERLRLRPVTIVRGHRSHSPPARRDTSDCPARAQSYWPRTCSPLTGSTRERLNSVGRPRSPERKRDRVAAGAPHGARRITAQPWTADAIADALVELLPSQSTGRMWTGQERTTQYGADRPVLASSYRRRKCSPPNWWPRECTRRIRGWPQVHSYERSP
jgi:hypothetical protein